MVGRLGTGRELGTVNDTPAEWDSGERGSRPDKRKEVRRDPSLLGDGPK